jgi:hypothetical protein
MVTTNHRVDLSISSKRGQIDCILGQCIETLFGIFGVDPTVSPDLIDGRFESGFGETSLLDDGLDARVFNESEEEMVLSDVRIVHGLLNGLGLSEDLESGRAEADLIWGWRLRGLPDDNTVECSLNSSLPSNISFECNHWSEGINLLDRRQLFE